MSDPAAIRGTFADFRLIKGRKVAQMVVEIPIEEADAALATLGGLPQPAAERWVALAALNVTSIKPQEKRRFEDLKSAMQAGIRCADPPFWKFLTEQYADNDVVRIWQRYAVRTKPPKLCAIFVGWHRAAISISIREPPPNGKS
jgi:hypothetical protein